MDTSNRILGRSWRRLGLPLEAADAVRCRWSLVAAIIVTLVSPLVLHAWAGGSVWPALPAGGARGGGDPSSGAHPGNVEVVFVLDTTGSMSGLIAGAKQKIWSIASDLVKADQGAKVRLGLVAYRDRGDAYVSRHFDLTRDIDSIYSALVGLTAEGGGDTPEAVNQALSDAVLKSSWTQGEGVYRSIFLVGDAPPHTDEPQSPAYLESLRQARERGILVNTVQCGDDPETARVWREIASASQGRYVSLVQDGGMSLAATPMDAELAELGGELRETALVFGDAEAQAKAQRKLSSADAASPIASAARLSYLASQGGRLMSGDSDLVDAVSEGEVSLEAVPSSALPPEIASLPLEEQKAAVAEKREARQRIQERVGKLLKQREEYLEGERDRRRSEGESLGFDDQVRDIVREQASENGIPYAK